MEIDKLTPEQIKEITDSIELVKVISSNLIAIGYSEQYKVLRVIFKNHTSYLYFNVEPEVYEKLKASESKGKTLNESIIKQKEKYKYMKII